MEITDVTSIDLPVEDPPVLEIRGRDMLWASSMIAALGCLPLCCSKKRPRYTIAGLSSSLPQTTAPVVESDPLPEVLRCPLPIRQIINNLWKQIGEGSVNPNLWFLGNQLEGEHQLHPFPYLLHLPKDRVRQAFAKKDWVSNYVRIPAILGGIERGITKALSPTKPARWPDFWTTLPVFAQHMNKDPERIKTFVEAQKWRELVEYLFELETV